MTETERLIERIEAELVRTREHVAALQAAAAPLEGIEFEVPEEMIEPLEAIIAQQEREPSVALSPFALAV